MKAKSRRTGWNAGRSGADFLRRLDRNDEARLAYEEALLLSENVVERAFLADRLGQVER